MNTAALLADAMTDYVLTVGINRAAPAAGRRSTWLHGWRRTTTKSSTTRRSGTGAVVAAIPDRARRITAAAEPRSYAGQVVADRGVGTGCANG